MARCLPTFQHRQTYTGTRKGFKYFQELVSLLAELKQVSARKPAFTQCIALQDKNSQNKNRQQQTHKLTRKAKAGMVYVCSKWCCSLHWKVSYHWHTTNYSLLFACLRASCAAAPDITKLSSSLWQSYLNRILKLGTFVLWISFPSGPGFQ